MYFVHGREDRSSRSCAAVICARSGCAHTWHGEGARGSLHTGTKVSDILEKPEDVKKDIVVVYEEEGDGEEGLVVAVLFEYFKNEDEVVASIATWGLNTTKKIIRWAKRHRTGQCLETEEEGEGELMEKGEGECAESSQVFRQFHLPLQRHRGPGTDNSAPTTNDDVFTSQTKHRKV